MRRAVARSVPAPRRSELLVCGKEAVEDAGFEDFEDEFGAALAVGHDDKSGFGFARSDGVAMGTVVVAAVIEEAVVLDLPTESPRAGELTIHDFGVRLEHLLDGFFFESEVVRLFGIENLDDEICVIGRRR